MVDKMACNDEIPEVNDGGIGNTPYTGGNLLKLLGFLGYEATADEYASLLGKIMEDGLSFDKGEGSYTLEFVNGSETSEKQDKAFIDMVLPMYKKNGRNIREVAEKSYCGHPDSKNIFVHDGEKYVGVFQFYSYEVKGEKIFHIRLAATETGKDSDSGDEKNPYFKGNAFEFLTSMALLSHDFDTLVVSSGISKVVSKLHGGFDLYTKGLDGKNEVLEGKAEKICEELGLPLHEGMVVYTTVDEDSDSIYSVGQDERIKYDSLKEATHRFFLISKEGHAGDLRAKGVAFIENFLKMPVITNNKTAGAA